MLHSDEHRVFHIGPWRVDRAARSLTNGSVERRISPRALRVLDALAEAQGDVVLRSDLLDRGWPRVTVGDESLTQVITELRRVFKTRASEGPVIETVARSGYRLTAPVFFEVDPAVAPACGAECGFDIDAYGLCLEARVLLSRSGPGSLERAEMVAREAAERAPTFALAQAEHAIMLVQRHLYRANGTRGLAEAVDRATQAIHLRPDLAIAQASLGYALGAVERWQASRRAFSRALQCDLNDADVHYLAARTFFAARDYSGATALAERAGALDRDNFRPLYLASRAASAIDPARARRLGEQTLQRVQARLGSDPHEPRAVNTLGPLLAQLGEAEAALGAMNAESAMGSPLEFYDLVARALIGDTDGAIRTLEAVADRGWCHPAWLSAEPALSRLNGHSGYRRIAAELGVA
ncbi:MAG: winged helix-turn-helix domain-containing protein [Pseudomonadota bacterium]